MKTRNILLGSTALATAGLIVAGGAAMAAEKLNIPQPERIKIEVHGYHQQFVVGLDQDFNDGDPGRTQRGFKTAVVDEKMNPEICFTGETKLDNGITVGVNVQLEGQLAADYLDEQYMYVTSEQYGQLLLGSENNAGYLLHVSAPDGGISVDSGDVINNTFYINTAITDLFDTPAGTTNLRLNDNDSQKVTYISPRVFGFQAGVSYIPKFQPGGGDGNSPDYNNGGGSNGQHNGWAGGLNYKQSFGDFNVQASGGLLWADQTSALDTDGNLNDLFGWNVGLQVGFAGFTVGGAYLSATSGDQGVGVSAKGESYSVGASYETGPYIVGVSWIQGWTDGLKVDPSDQEHRTLAVSGSYQMGPGVRLVGGFFWFDDEAEDGRNAAGNLFSPNTSDTDGWGGVVGFKLSF
jgi:predicted porin